MTACITCITCPICRTALETDDPLRPGQVVVCAYCEGEFPAPPPPPPVRPLRVVARPARRPQRSTAGTWREGVVTLFRMFCLAGMVLSMLAGIVLWWPAMIVGVFFLILEVSVKKYQ
jgi:hypothetical protein